MCDSTAKPMDSETLSAMLDNILSNCMVSFDTIPLKKPEPVSNDAPAKSTTTTPFDVDIIETPENFIVKADVCGLDKKDISISVKGSIITITGEKAADAISPVDKYLTRERKFGKFSKTIQLPRGSAVDHVRATYLCNTLTLTVPKTSVEKIRMVKIE